jgi:hypothetical protein
MKPTISAKTFAITITTALALGIAPWAMADDKGCSVETLKGTFGYIHRSHPYCPDPRLSRAGRRGRYAIFRRERRCHLYLQFEPKRQHKFRDRIGGI